MKKIFVLIIMLNSIYCFSQDQKAVIDLFKKKLATVDSLFLKPPTFLESEEFSDSKTGKINYLIKVVKLESSYDIQSTNSIVSPYTAYIILKLQVFSNQSLGNVKSTGLTWGFETEEQARQVDVTSSCTHDSKDNEEEWCVGEVKINYAFQDGVWVFKGIDTETANKIKNGTSRGDIEKELTILK